MNASAASRTHRSVELGLQAVAIFVKDEVHAAVGPPRLFIEAAAGLFFLRCGRADGHLLGPAEIGSFLVDHTAPPFCAVLAEPARFNLDLYNDIATSRRNLRGNSDPVDRAPARGAVSLRLVFVCLFWRRNVKIGGFISHVCESEGSPEEDRWKNTISSPCGMSCWASGWC